MKIILTAIISVVITVGAGAGLMYKLRVGMTPDKPTTVHVEPVPVGDLVELVSASRARFNRKPRWPSVRK